MNYKFIHIGNTNKLDSFMDKYGYNMKRILKSCFNINFDDQYSWEDNYDSFFLIDELSDEVIAFAGTVYKKITQYDAAVEKYKLIKFDDFNASNFLNKKSTTLLGPIIESLCRDSNPRYKGTGTILLKKICEFYKKRSVETIYLVPESTKYKKFGLNDCGVELNKDNYIKSQIQLHKFYNKFGFKELKHNYEIDICDKYIFNPRILSPLVFYPVFYKDL